MTAPAATLSDRLEELARRVEALSGPNYAMDHQISVAIGRPENGMTQTVGTDADIIGVPRSVLAAACYIIRNSEHAESETAKAMREYALSTQAAELDALRGEMERLKKVEIRSLNYEIMLKRDDFNTLEEALTTIAQLRDRVAALEEGLRVARGQFAFYVEQHLLKSPPDEAKAKTNQAHVGRIDALLTQNEVG